MRKKNRLTFTWRQSRSIQPFYIVPSLYIFKAGQTYHIGISFLWWMLERRLNNPNKLIDKI